MINLKRIKRDAADCAADIRTNVSDILSYGQTMFLKGATYQSQKVWHRPNQRPKTYFLNGRVSLLLLRGNFQSTVTTFTREEISQLFLFRDFRKYDNSIIAWAYLEELKP